ncbi:hypothetical protein JTE90_012154 [Oedothorax gibbosus]|uniref:Uncharacterized protein n=1 Tax=Oedothorax gibbosus TaxID=931172 RepID=A0AAV6UK55_9ARAC|nr:hypothetical protein JTE90_012154 [Oedothorax gibbosus]
MGFLYENYNHCHFNEHLPWQLPFSKQLNTYKSQESISLEQHLCLSLYPLKNHSQQRQSATYTLLQLFPNRDSLLHTMLYPFFPYPPTITLLQDLVYCSSLALSLGDHFCLLLDSAWGQQLLVGALGSTGGRPLCVMEGRAIWKGLHFRCVPLGVHVGTRLLLYLE